MSFFMNGAFSFSTDNTLHVLQARNKLCELQEAITLTNTKIYPVLPHINAYLEKALVAVKVAVSGEGGAVQPTFHITNKTAAVKAHDKQTAFPKKKEEEKTRKCVQVNSTIDPSSYILLQHGLGCTYV